MAPTVPISEISDLTISSLELDARSTTLDELISNSIPVSVLKRDDLSLLSSPNEVFNTLTARDGGNIKTPDHSGAVDPNNISMKGVQALIAIIGASFVVGIIWFFFWAKNGGFQWRKGDWDDYKSTVLRRKGPNGTTLSNATKSTKLGGGSVVGEGFSDGSGSTVEGTFSETMTVTDMSSEAPLNQTRTKKESAKERKMREAKAAAFEGGHDQDVLAYIREKPARVGGINKDSEAYHYGTDYTDTEGSGIHSIRQPRSHAPRGTASNSSRQTSPEKRQTRRDFSYGQDDTFSSVSSTPPEVAAPPIEYPEVPPPAPPHRPGRYHSPSKQLNHQAYQQPLPQQQQQQYDNRRSQYTRPNIQTASYVESSVVSEIQNQNTKAYHHPLPSLSGQMNQNQNQSPVRGGYRRDRRDSLDD